MNYKKELSLNFYKIIVEVDFSTILGFVCILCLLAIISMKYIEKFIFSRSLQMDPFMEGTSVSFIFANKIEIYFLASKLEIYSSTSKVEIYFL